MRKILILLTASLLIFSACGSDDEETSNMKTTEEEKTEDVDQNDLTNDPEEETTEDDVSWDDLKNPNNIVGNSNKDFSDITNEKPTDVRNDTTGNWRKITISDGKVNIVEYALSYQDLHMREGEVHHIINFENNTTTWLNNLGGLLYVDVKEYVDGEEHDASTLGSGMLLNSYVIYPDGDIEELEEAE